MKIINYLFNVEMLKGIIHPIFEQIFPVKNEYFTRLKNWYSVTIHLDLIQNRPNSL
jgi:hypothetical protein